MGTLTDPLINLLGGTFFGEVVTAIGFGILTVQISSYYRAFPNDGRLLKVAVGFLWALEAFQLGCVSQYLYGGFIKHYYNPLPLARSTWEFGMFQVTVVVASVTVQTFFAHHVYSLSGNLYLGIFVPLCSFSSYLDCTWLIVTWLAIQAVSDVVIATCMCILLRRRRTGFQRTDSIINRMVFYTIATGSVTGVLSCLVLGLFVKLGFEFGVLILSVPLSALYSITMLANLHARKTLRTKLAQSTPLQVMNSSAKTRKPQSTVVHITQETTVHDEMGGKLTNSSHSYPPASIYPFHFHGEQ
ncbi:hypothetical protein BS47DRAFT_140719 [Hydnum rufescens UP504]|uniref:DUF6534 domain-containing protein n=1 Tax=Hydnum rufescens UP504 TaxID=1448309 RepID=A0A9P6AQ69_9AGAM|nr:hypothetical protein BS47DRAFT_140719 [Hydnum rufescens UP504]